MASPTSHGFQDIEDTPGLILCSSTENIRFPKITQTITQQLDLGSPKTTILLIATVSVKSLLDTFPSLVIVTRPTDPYQKFYFVNTKQVLMLIPPQGLVDFPLVDYPDRICLLDVTQVSTNFARKTIVPFLDGEDE